MKTDVVIVNWNSGTQLARCLASINEFGKKQVSKVVVVDNGSTDGSAQNLGESRVHLEIVLNESNRGFACACNQGAAVCTAPYILFLNPDTVLFENSLGVPAEFMLDAANANVGICGIQLLDEGGRVSRSCAYFPSLKRYLAEIIGLNRLPYCENLGVHMNGWNHLSTATVDHVIGAFFFIRRAIFECLGGFDESYFVYLEDVDLSLRARKNGWTTMYLADARAFHAGGGTSRQVKAARLFYSLCSRILYAFKHFSKWKAWVLLVATLFIEPISRLVLSLGRGDVQELRNTWQGYGMLFRHLPEILRVSARN